MLFLKKIIFRYLCTYSRSNKFNLGQWRLIKFLLPWSRKIGKNFGVVEVKTKFNFRMSLNMSDWLAQHVFVTGDYEPATSKLICEKLQQGQCFVDIGANIGYFSLLASKIVGESGQVIGFEPVEGTREKFDHNVKINGINNIKVEPYAISDSNGSSEIFVGPEEHCGISSLTQPHNFTAKQHVELRTLDSLISDTKINFIKIDVEGYELKALRGMTTIIEKNSPDFICEVTEDFLKNAGDSTADLFDFFNKYNYSAFRIDYDGLKKVHDILSCTKKQCNVYFSKK